MCCKKEKNLGVVFMHTHTHTHTHIQQTGEMGVNLLFEYLYIFWYFDVSDDIFAMFVKRIKVQVLQLQVGTDSNAVFHLWTVPGVLILNSGLTSLRQASIHSCHWSEVIHIPSVSLRSPSALVTLQQDDYDRV